MLSRQDETPTRLGCIDVMIRDEDHHRVFISFEGTDTICNVLSRHTYFIGRSSSLLDITTHYVNTCNLAPTMDASRPDA